MKGLGWFAAVAAAILAVGVGWRVIGEGIAPCDAYTAVPLHEVDAADGCITVTAQAHYDVVVNQRAPGNLLVADKQYYLFPLFEEGDTSNRAIRVFVRTERPPESLVTYETMTVSGRLQPITSREIPPGTEVSIGQKSDYFFTDSMRLLVPDRVVSEGEEWVAPHAK